MVTSSQYMGRVISAVDHDCLEGFRNFTRAKEVWKNMTSILIREGAKPRVSFFFFKATF